MSENEKCPKCKAERVPTPRKSEGDGSLWADGKLHYPSHNGETRACPQCGGAGRIPPADYRETAAALLAKMKENAVRDNTERKTQ